MQKAMAPLPEDKESLSKLVRQQQLKIDQQSQFIEQLLEQIRLARHQHFGARSERFNINQMALCFDGVEINHDSALKVPTPTLSQDSLSKVTTIHSKAGRRPLPPELPRVEIIHELDESDRMCHCCHQAMSIVSEKTSEQLDIIPAQVQVLRHVRRTYVCKSCNGKPVTAKQPVQPIPKSMASSGTLASIAISKYVDGMPLYRQQQALKRINVDLPRSTLSSWMIKAGQLVQPLINVMRDSMLDYDIITMDETRLQVLKEPGKSAQSQSYLWVQRGGPPDQPIVLYDYEPSRASSVPEKLLGDFKGYLQTDGYEGYNAICKANGLIQLGCWAHVRRKFDEAIKAQSNNTKKLGKVSLAAQAMQRIQQLYQIEQSAKHEEAESRYIIRQQRSLQILNEFRQWLDTHLMIVPPRSSLGKAMQYADKQWPKLTNYTLDGRLRIDNNLTENAIRPFVIGRKNWLFSDSVAGANASANLYSLIETAKANQIEPYRYLRRLFSELPKATHLEDLERLLPFGQRTAQGKGV